MREAALSNDRKRQLEDANRELAATLAETQRAREVLQLGTEIQTTFHADGEMAVVTVRDHGAGIPEDEIPRLFQPFSRSGASRTTVDGVGLGLYITRKIVEQHGGTITVESRVGAGNMFTVRLPFTGVPVG